MSAAAPLQPVFDHQVPGGQEAKPAASNGTSTGIEGVKSGWEPQPGRLGNLSVPQQHTLEKFREALKTDPNFPFDEKRHDDSTLLRYLRARKFDMGAAKIMIVNSEQWRKDFGVDDLMKNFNFKEKAEVDKFYPQFYHKMDKEGRPVYIERLRNINVTEMYKITTPQRLLQQLVYEYERFEQERLPACSAAVGHPVETSCTILDLAGVGLKQFWDVKSYISDAAKIGQDRYPERMGKFYLINAPFGFSTVWNLIKGWLDPVTQAKIKILGSKYKPDLLDAIDEANLPVDLGGSCKECAAAGGCSLSDAGPWNVKRAENEETIKNAPVA